MSLEDFIAEVIRQAGLLGLTSWERLAVIFGLAILIVLAKVGGGALLGALKTASGPVDNAPPSDGGASGPGTALPTDPNRPDIDTGGSG